MRIEPEYPVARRMSLNVNDILLALENFDLMKQGRWPVTDRPAIHGKLRAAYPAARDFIDEILRRLAKCGRDGRLVERYYIEYRNYPHAERELKCLNWINDFSGQKWNPSRLWQSINNAIEYIAKTTPRLAKDGRVYKYRDWLNHGNITHRYGKTVLSKKALDRIKKVC